MKKKIIIGLFALLFVALLMSTGSVFATPSNPVFGTFVNSGDVPAGSKLIINVSLKVVNDEDSGISGYWALSDYNRVLKVWQVPDGSFYVVARYTGQWQTFKGAVSPGDQAAVQTKDASGTFEGGYVGTFTATAFTTAKGNLGTFDYKGTKADILLGTYGAGQTGPSPNFDWVGTYFTGFANFAQSPWGWTYHYRSQTWYNYESANIGDIVV